MTSTQQAPESYEAFVTRTELDRWEYTYGGFREIKFYELVGDDYTEEIAGTEYVCGGFCQRDMLASEGLIASVFAGEDTGVSFGPLTEAITTGCQHCAMCGVFMWHGTDCTYPDKTIPHSDRMPTWPDLRNAVDADEPPMDRYYGPDLWASKE